MKDIPIKLGPLALLLTVISICMTTLAILTFTTARADRRLADTYAKTVQTSYSLEAEGQQFLAELARAGGPENMDGLERDEAGTYWKTIDRGERHLRIGFDWNGSITIRCWRQEQDWNQTEEIGNLWPGF
mgnify:CR=1 FL=1